MRTKVKKRVKRVSVEGELKGHRDTESRGDARARGQSSGDAGDRVADKGLRGKPKIVSSKKRPKKASTLRY